MRHHLVPVATAGIKKTRNKGVGEHVEKKEPRALLLGVQIGAATVENSIEVTYKIKSRTTVNYSGIPLLRIYPRKIKTLT